MKFMIKLNIILQVKYCTNLSLQFRNLTKTNIHCFHCVMLKHIDRVKCVGYEDVMIQDSQVILMARW